MSARTKRQRVLAIVATDATFEQTMVRGSPAWVGRCIHCNARLVVGLDGETGTLVTIEHIRPRAQGGTDEPFNLALACARCNHEKGRRHDVRRADDPKVVELVEKLSSLRRARWREPEA